VKLFHNRDLHRSQIPTRRGLTFASLCPHCCRSYGQALARNLQFRIMMDKPRKPLDESQPQRGNVQGRKKPVMIHSANATTFRHNRPSNAFGHSLNGICLKDCAQRRRHQLSHHTCWSGLAVACKVSKWSIVLVGDSLTRA
jgi:hypothetical protein